MECPKCKGTGKLTAGNITVGDLIFSVRTEKDISLDGLAQKLSTTPEYLMNVEQGKIDLSLRFLFSLASALGCSPKELIP